VPELKIGNIDLEKAASDLTDALKEAAYVAVGLGVLGFQRAQVQRVELMKQVEAQLAGLSDLSGRLGSQAEAYLTTAREQLAQIQAQLAKLAESVPGVERPDPAVVREQLAGLARSVDEAVAPVRRQFEDQLDRLQEVLPETARQFVQTVRGAAAASEQNLRSAVGLA
jgi:hypothetical protein